MICSCAVRDLIRQTHQGFYGDENKHAGVDAQLCASVIDHSHTFCNHLIEQDDALSGTVDDLMTECQPTPPDGEEDIETEMEPFPAGEDGETSRCGMQKGEGFVARCEGPQLRASSASSTAARESVE